MKDNLGSQTERSELGGGVKMNLKNNISYNDSVSYSPTKKESFSPAKYSIDNDYSKPNSIKQYDNFSKE